MEEFNLDNRINPERSVEIEREDLLPIVHAMTGLGCKCTVEEIENGYKITCKDYLCERLKAELANARRERAVLKAQLQTVQNAPDWVSVEELLPDTDVEVIVLTKAGRVSFGHIVDKGRAVDYNGWNIRNVEYWRRTGITPEMERAINMFRDTARQEDFI